MAIVPPFGNAGFNTGVSPLMISEPCPFNLPPCVTAGLHLQKVKALFRKGLSKREIAKRIGISRTRFADSLPSLITRADPNIKACVRIPNRSQG
jgi:hypothetical protein